MNGKTICYRLPPNIEILTAKVRIRKVKKKIGSVSARLSREFKFMFTIFLARTEVWLTKEITYCFRILSIFLRINCFWPLWCYRSYLLSGKNQIWFVTVRTALYFYYFCVPSINHICTVINILMFFGDTQYSLSSIVRGS